MGRGVIDSVLQHTKHEQDYFQSRDRDEHLEDEEEMIFFDERTSKAMMNSLDWDLGGSTSETSTSIEELPIWRHELVSGSGARLRIADVSTNPSDNMDKYGSTGNQHGLDWEALTMITTQSTQESYEEERINILTYKV